jgi:hypothetical protein
MSSKKNARHFIAMWDRKGLECIFDLTKLKAEHEEWEKKVMWGTLQGEKFQDIEPSIPLNMMILRARVNSQREYEIYEFTSYLDMDELKREFKLDPQPLVDWIRKNGYKVYSDYVKPERHVIR